MNEYDGLRILALGKVVMYRSSRRCVNLIKLSILMLISLTLCVLSTHSMGGMRVGASIVRGEAIPENYKSWSLFLLCNPGWSLDSEANDIEQLYSDFEAFSRSIGRENVAVWFTTEPVSLDKGAIPSAGYDFERAAELCSLYHLPPSKGPYIIVTTVYPDRIAPLQEFFKVSLHNLDARSIRRLLDLLIDQIVAERLDQIQIDSEHYWRQWERIWRGMLTQFIGSVDKLTVAFDVKFFKVELTMAGGG